MAERDDWSASFGSGAHSGLGDALALTIVRAGVDLDIPSGGVSYLPSANAGLPVLDFIRLNGGVMIAVIFEVWPADGRKEQYLDIAAELRPLLDGIDGFISIERFESLTEPGKILSLSFWRDEEALQHWRGMEPHRAAQTLGRSEVFADYRLRIAGVLRDYGMSERDQAPADSRAVHG